MSSKQNNDDSENGKWVPSSSKTVTQQTNTLKLESQRERVSESEEQNMPSAKMSKRQSQVSSAKNQAKESQLPITQPALTPAPQTLLPITIFELQQKTLNLYLKQFMQITTFQTIQKGKQLIELIKQAPGSKQTTSVINKCMKLFKSGIPDAVLCSFQFFRQLIEVGYWKISDAMQELLLMPIVEIIEYRAYLPQIQRGNSYFLGQCSRQGQDEKANHLVKIGSTFFRMVHQVLYVWGTFYFPESNFSKMLIKLIRTDNIRFPVFPQEFRFYSQARVELFRNILEKNRKLYQKEEREFKSKRVHEKGSQVKNAKDIQLTGTKNDPSKEISSKKENAFTLTKKEDTDHKNSQTVNPSIKETSKDLKSDQVTKQKVPIQKSPRTAKSNSPVKLQPNPPEEMQSIELKRETKKQPKQEREQKKTDLPAKNVEEFKKIKPSKVKSKKSAFSINTGQKSVDMDRSRVESFNETENALRLIEEVEQVEVFSPGEKKHEIESPKKIQQKVSITKDMLKIDLKRLKKERSQSEIYVKNQVDSQENSKAIIEEQTFRQVESYEAGEHKNNIFDRELRQQQSSTVNVMSSERERYVEPVTEESVERGAKKDNQLREGSLPSNQAKFSDTQMRQFFRKELQSLKASVIDSIRENIMEVVISQKSKETVGSGKQNNGNVKINSDEQDQRGRQLKVEGNVVSARFGAEVALENQNKDPSAEAFEFIKRKFKSGKKLRTSSKLKRASILQDQELKQKQKEEERERMKENLKANSVARVVTQFGVNTEQIGQEKIYDEINELKQKIDLIAQVLPGPRPLLVKRENNFFKSPTTNLNSFLVTPTAINKNQLQFGIRNQNLQSSYQADSLKSTGNSIKKKSKSKLSQRRSSLEASLLQKAVLRPESCRNLFGEVYGGTDTFLFNAAVNSVQKKRRSVMFC